MRIIGLDLSLTAPGWYFCDTARPQNAQCGTWQPQGRGLDRMDWICRKVLHLLPEAGSGAQVILEGFAFGAKGAAVYEIAGFGYIVRLALRYRSVPVLEVAPSQLKKYATGKGNATKEIIIREVYKRWGFEARDNNEADAFVLGQIGLALAGLSEPATEFQRAVLKDLAKAGKVAA